MRIINGLGYTNAMVNLVVACWYCFKIGIAVLLFLAVVGCWCSNEAYRTNVIYGIIHVPARLPVMKLIVAVFSAFCWRQL